MPNTFLMVTNVIQNMHKCLQAAQAGGAQVLVLCDTNGGTMPFEIAEIIEEIKPHLNTSRNSCP